MKVALLGATGFVGSALLKEALDRGHVLTAIVRVLLLELLAVALLMISGLFGGSLVLEDRVGVAEPHAHADRGGSRRSEPV
jgi:putative NADH-flavin reductase